MGRRNLTVERQTIILDAMERCIAKYGLQATTLENIAEEAGLNRGLIHHYIGNRNDVIQLMAERLLVKYQSSFKSYVSTRLENNRADIMVDYYFDAWFDLAPSDDAIIHSLFAESERDPRIRKLLLKLYDGFEKMIAGELGLLFPEMTSEKLHSLSYALMLLAFAHASLNWLGLPQAKKTDVRSTAVRLIQDVQYHKEKEQ